MKLQHISILAAVAATAFTSCDKVSPVGVLVAGTAVEDRVKMSSMYYDQYLEDFKMAGVDEEYSFIVGSDSHLTDDPGRMDEMLAIGLANDDLFYAHLGDIADTKAEYYIRLDSLIQQAKKRYVAKHFETDDNEHYYAKGGEHIPEAAQLYDNIVYPFFSVVGNHDITHNGWALWSSIFHSSFYEFPVDVSFDETGDNTVVDRFIFLDTASGTLGQTQIDLIEDGTLDGDGNTKYRHTFVFSHTNIFRPSSWQFASTFPREETFFLLNKFKEWGVTIAFCGHVHAWDDRVFEDVTYLTLDSMGERNSPNPGDYLVRVKVLKDGTVTWEKVHMSYVKNK